MFRNTKLQAWHLLVAQDVKLFTFIMTDHFNTPFKLEGDMIKRHSRDQTYLNDTCLNFHIVISKNKIKILLFYGRVQTNCF